MPNGEADGDGEPKNGFKHWDSSKPVADAGVPSDESEQAKEGYGLPDISCATKPGHLVCYRQADSSRLRGVRASV